MIDLQRAELLFGCMRQSHQQRDQWEAAFRQKYETEMIERFDTHFYVGTVHQHPHTWINVGLFYPPKVKERPMPLFDAPPPDEYDSQ